MWSTIICMMCNGENFQISPRLPKRKNQCVRSLVSFQCFMSVVLFREGESECRRCGSLMFLGFYMMCFDMFGYVYVCEYIPYMFVRNRARC
jgi:hypothetical protein